MKGLSPPSKNIGGAIAPPQPPRFLRLCIYLCCNGSRLQAPSGKGEIRAILGAKVHTHSSKPYIVVSLADLLQKAFNTVEYGCLCINKLHFDIETSLHNLLSSYFNDYSMEWSTIYYRFNLVTIKYRSRYL